MTNPYLELLFTDSLEKIFPDADIGPIQPLSFASMLLNERYSFQAVYCLTGDRLIKGKITLSGSLAPYVTVRQVGLVPSQLPNYPDGDDFVLRKTPGLYPDPLYPVDVIREGVEDVDLSAEVLTLIPGQWRSLWITVPEDCALLEGVYDLTLTVMQTSPEDPAGAAFIPSEPCSIEIRRLPAVLPEQTLIHTQWFHTDCIADWYRVPVFSEAYWELTEKYMMNAASCGVNMLLTPLFTPPLDTAPGGERTTVQLVDVYRTREGYEFGLDKLERWIALCDRCGMKYLEFSHLFTQWGAGFAPKIMAYPCSKREVCSGSRPVRIFGWDTPADSREYREFLQSFLPVLTEFIKERGLKTRCFFHISDEPGKKQLPAYLSARELVEKYLEGMPVMDALSDYDFYEQGGVDLPICSSDHIGPFLEHKTENLWTYYCCGQYKEVANSFFSMPSVRNRILGVQLYKFGIKGFLHWGFNFWNAALSTHPVNPFQVTDAECAFPSGDAFLVYPGADGPIGSLREEVLMEGLQDMRALQLLESLTDRETVLELLESGLDREITFREYPHEAQWLLHMRERCNGRIRLEVEKICDGK
ncbi:DUF4091 domain-containing protein [Lachnotalea sp. AF33-28]|uniref:DUF4091 domain-containing protein n=1 Tax=Lachnotalea sp. AF33-28 TaxID=2292046 RepID=UPI000E53CA90|nr:DUF4091 domain-containing protein [Lachnotalea sp. AF33-28]RHP36208.1 DUF4091 domain-containing protein [Lachnotalea sp. AF33-28]